MRVRRAVDLSGTATAWARDLPICTRNPDDFRDLHGLVDVIAV